MLLLVAVGGFLLFELRARPGKTLRLAAAWAMIFLGVIALAGLWGDIRQAVAPQAGLDPTLVLRGARKIQEQIEAAVAREAAD